jgi:hypothetical protein
MVDLASMRALSSNWGTAKKKKKKRTKKLRKIISLLFAKVSNDFPFNIKVKVLFVTYKPTLCGLSLLL